MLKENKMTNLERNTNWKSNVNRPSGRQNIEY